MMTKMEVTKTYWVGMTFEQRNEVKNVLVRLLDNPMSSNFKDIISCGEEHEALEALRLALLNS